MIDNAPVRPTVRVIEVCHDPLARRFAFPRVRNIQRHRIANGNDLRTELQLNTGRFDRPGPDDRKAFLDLGYQLVQGLPVIRFQFDFTPSRRSVDPNDDPFIGPHALAKATGISRNQVYLAIEVGAIDTFVSKWRGRDLTYIVVNDRLAHWMWTQTPAAFDVAGFTFPESYSRNRGADLFEGDRSDHDELVDAIIAGEVLGELRERADGSSATVNADFRFVKWLASRRHEYYRNMTLEAACV